jgi:hypothetical protein
MFQLSRIFGQKSEDRNIWHSIRNYFCEQEQINKNLWLQNMLLENFHDLTDNEEILLNVLIAAGYVGIPFFSYSVSLNQARVLKQFCHIYS